MGVGDDSYPNTIGRKDAGLVHYSPDAPANNLSFSSLRRAGIKLEYDYGADI